MSQARLEVTLLSARMERSMPKLWLNSWMVSIKIIYAAVVGGTDGFWPQLSVRSSVKSSFTSMNLPICLLAQATPHPPTRSTRIVALRTRTEDLWKRIIVCGLPCWQGVLRQPNSLTRKSTTSKRCACSMSSTLE